MSLQEAGIVREKGWDSTHNCCREIILGQVENILRQVTIYLGQRANNMGTTV
jgi:hypothetical protein